MATTTPSLGTARGNFPLLFKGRADRGGSRAGAFPYWLPARSAYHAA
jgi:hypothetical protein